MNILVPFLLVASLSLGSAEPLAVIIHPECPLQAMTRQEAADLFMGRRRRLPSGETALVVEALRPEEVRAAFYRALTGLALPDVRARWAQAFFSGQGQPPCQVPDSKAMLDLVAAHRGAVGFVARSQVTPRVKLVLVLDAGDAAP